MELIAVVVQGSPGRSGLWRFRQPDSVVDDWLRVAREHKALLLLNIWPGRAAFLDDVAGYVSSIVEANHLPEKALVYHQVARSVVREPAGIKRYDGVQIIRSIDGIGSRAKKTSTWKWIGRQRNPAVRPGFKLFFSEDGRRGTLMTPAQVLALTPRPDYVMYE